MVDLRGKTPCDGVDCDIKSSCFRRFLLKLKSNKGAYYSGASLMEEARNNTNMCKKYIHYSPALKKKIASSVTDKYEFNSFVKDYEETIGRKVRIKI